jgi:hypothetical protein
MSDRHRKAISGSISQDRGRREGSNRQEESRDGRREIEGIGKEVGTSKDG